MKRREFIQNTILTGASTFINPLLLKAWGDPGNGINLPGSYEPIKDKSLELNRNSDMAKYYADALEAIKKKDLNQERIIREIMARLYQLPSGEKRNGFTGRATNTAIRDVMNLRSKRAVTPVYGHKSDAAYFSFRNLCDASDKVLCEDGSVTVQATDNREDKSAYIVDEAIAYLLHNPKYYCLGLPNAYPEKIFINADLKKEIFLKTRKETTKSYYMKQRFTFLGSSICTDGLKTGPKETTMNYDTDAAIDLFYDFTSIEACGDPKDLKCNLKI